MYCDSNRFVRAVDLNAKGPAVLVFRTDLTTEAKISAVKPLLDTLPGLEEWSVDRADCDKVLRVVGYGLYEQEVIKVLKKEGVYAEILP